MLRVTCLLFIFLQMGVELKESVYRQFVVDSLKYPTEKQICHASFLI